ncbi:sugar ABC transporter ATP-binding protein [Amycolatopsis pithecellobii]|uniref:ATP-binding cassette domain-containing protein n=1 Tax=Amycolatopsis pithecellobii TaxID=664692 RepID=A0A6N7YUD6_9PSEU|nr:sugar ABC transporter ATP-binding protein [Amycolatopsis pithecellobii]MTD55538.1 ATP-binding cassette domain-containing protein [Amycolatopsis pithecellobii]
MNTQDELFVLKGVWKTYNGPLVLSDVDLTLRGGRVHALVGHNGCGKSTLIRIMAGAERAEPAGAAYLDGAPVELNDSHSHHHRRLHFIHQGLNVIPHLSTLENVALGTGYPKRFGIIRWRSHRMRIREILHRIGADFDLDRPVHTLLPNQLVVVAIARAMAHWTDSRSVLVLDEATAALPAPEVEQLFTTVRHAVRDGAAVLFVSHRLDEVLRFADDVTVLRNGQVVMNAERDELTKATLLDALLGHQQHTTPSGNHARAETGKGTALRVQNLTTERIREASLTIESGEILGVAGLDGSGREQFADAVYGTIPRAGGEILLNGNTVPARPRGSVKAGMGLVPADRPRSGVIPEMSVRVNETLPRLKQYRRATKLLDKRREQRDVSTYLENVDMTPGSTEKKIKFLSGGNQQKVVISRWLRHGVDVLLLDEPVQGIDVGAKEVIFNLVRDAARNGTAVVMCSAVDEDLAALCDRVVVFDHGAIVAELRAPDITVARIAAASHAFKTGTL